VRFLGLALFLFSALVLGCFSLSRYAPNAPSVNMTDRAVARSFLYHRWATSPRLHLQIVMTLAIGAAAVWIIVVAEQEPDDRTWAYGTLAMLLGYWLKR
jgi:hypothetical protein